MEAQHEPWTPLAFRGLLQGFQAVAVGASLELPEGKPKGDGHLQFIQTSSCSTQHNKGLDNYTTFSCDRD